MARSAVCSGCHAITPENPKTPFPYSIGFIKLDESVTWEKEDKHSIAYKRLNEIDVGEIARFRAELVQSGELSEKRINNILAVLSKALKYAADCEVIAKAPKVGLFKVERPEIVVTVRGIGYKAGDPVPR